MNTKAFKREPCRAVIWVCVHVFVTMVSKNSRNAGKLTRRPPCGPLLSRVLLTFGVAAAWGWGVVRCEASVVCNARKDGCSCVFNDSSGILDVSSLSNTDGTPRFKDVVGSDNRTYSYNPCGPFALGNCSDAAVCQVSRDGRTSTQTGDAGTARWLVLDNYTVTIFYEHLDQGPSPTDRQNFVTYLCDPTADSATMTMTGGDGTQVYYFTVVSKCACPNGCSGNPSGPGKLSGGSVLLIIFVVLVALYLLGGAAYKRTRYGSAGLGMVPNIDFWRSIPVMIKDGCLFLTCQLKPNYNDIS